MSVLDSILHDLTDYLGNYVAFSDPAHPIAVALFVATTYVADQFDASPYLHLKSEVRQCGKTLTLEAVSLVVCRPWMVVMPSEAVVFRKLDEDKPTILLDEVDAIYGKKKGDHEGLRAILNAGHRRGAKVPRCTDKGKLLEFEVGGPKVLAGIGELPDTIADRAIPIPLKRKAPVEKVSRFRVRKVEPHTIVLSERLQSWADRADLWNAEPELPDELSDRQQDIWEPLLAVADEAGGAWPELARMAAKQIHTVAPPAEENVKLLLLADCRRVFGERERIPTEDLLEGLHGLEGQPWAEFGRSQKPLTKNMLARLLKGFEVKPQVLRFGEATARGYSRDSFEDAWTRYLPHISGNGNGLEFATVTQTQQGEAV